jgi:hypothetical protein
MLRHADQSYYVVYDIINAFYLLLCVVKSLSSHLKEVIIYVDSSVVGKNDVCLVWQFSSLTLVGL